MCDATITWLLYATDSAPPDRLWRICGLAHTFIVHCIMEQLEEKVTATLYFHGLCHVWRQPRLPISLSDNLGYANNLMFVSCTVSIVRAVTKRMSACFCS